MTGSAGYITVTIGLPDPAQLSAHPYIYIHALRARTLMPAPERTSCSSKQFLIKFRLFTL
jgi:hypothetical protein